MQVFGGPSTHQRAKEESKIDLLYLIMQWLWFPGLALVAEKET